MNPYAQFCGQDDPGLYLVQTQPSPSYTCDIVFIHGLGGGPSRSWMHPGTKKIWFQDLLPDYIADNQLGTNARVWTFGYNSGKIFSVKASIYDYSTQLLNRVYSIRDSYEHHKIIWVCHSLGGLIVKSALIAAQINAQYRAILNETVGIVFLGTPHQGSALANMAAIIARIAEKTLVVKPPTELFRSLIRDSDALDQSCRSFPNICQHIKIWSFYEMVTTGRNLVVERSSVLMNLPGEEQFGLNADHTGLCKFSGQNDQNFLVVCNAIRVLMRLTSRRPRAIDTTVVPAIERRPLPTPPTVIPLSNLTRLDHPINPTSMISSPSNLAGPDTSANSVTSPSDLASPNNLVNSTTIISSPSNFAYQVNLVPPPQPANPIPREHTINYSRQASYDINPPPMLRRAVTTRDVPQLIQQLVAARDGRQEDSRISAAEHLARIAQTTHGRDYVATAVNAEVLRQLVDLLSDPGILRLHVVVILAVVLYFDRTAAAALNTPVIRHLIRLLSDPFPEIQVSAACALANIAQNDQAKEVAANAGAIPPLVSVLDCESSQLKEAAVRAIREIAATDTGQKAVYNSNAVHLLARYLADTSLSFRIQYDVVGTLAIICSYSRDAKKKIKEAGVFAKLTRFKGPTIPQELQDVAINLRDKLR